VAAPPVKSPLSPADGHKIGAEMTLKMKIIYSLDFAGKSIVPENTAGAKPDAINHFFPPIASASPLEIPLTSSPWSSDIQDRARRACRRSPPRLK
jgi:hypothetical protein